MRLRKIEIRDLREARKAIEEIGSDPKSIDIMAPKAVFRTIIVEGVKPVDAIIIKQDMLSIGGEVAIPRNVFEEKGKDCNILIMGTLKHFKELKDKLLRHHQRIRGIAKELEKFLEEEYEDRKQGI